MIVEIKEGEVLIKFSLSNPQRRWHITSPSRKRKVKSGQFYGLELAEDDLLEVMIDWGELRDILSAYCRLEPQEFRCIKNFVSNLAPQAKDPERAPETEKIVDKIEIKREKIPKQRKPEEEWIGIFVYLPLFGCENTNLLNNMGVSKMLPGRIQSGDVLVWKPNKAVLMALVEVFTSTSPDYKSDIEKEVLGSIKEINGCE